MKTNITLEIDTQYLPELYALLNGELMSAKELLSDPKFTEKYTNLTRRAERAVANLTTICNKLLEEF